MSFETLRRCQSNWTLDNPCVRIGWQFDAESVEAGFELVGILGLNVVKMGWVLMEGKLRVFKFGKDVGGEGVVCRRVGRVEMPCPDGSLGTSVRSGTCVAETARKIGATYGVE